MSYPPLPQPQDLVKIRPVESGVPSPITRYVPISELPVSGGGVGAVTDGVHTVTNATTIDFTGGATVTNLGGGVAGVSISGGGGGGALAAGLGTYLDTISNPGTTIVGNTGTIAQPASTGTSSLGIDLSTGAVTNAGTAGSYPTSAGFTIANLGVTLTDPAGSGYSSPNNLTGGAVTNGTVTGGGATIHFAGAGLYADGHVGGEALRITAGSVSGNNSSDVAGFLLITAGGVTNAGTAGNLTLSGGSAPMGVGVAGNLVLAGGGGGAAGGFIELLNVPTADPGTVAAPAGVWADNGVLVQTGHTAGGGGGVTAGLGIYVNSGTVGNTGTLIRSVVTVSGTATVIGPGVTLEAANMTLTNPAGAIHSGDVLIQTGSLQSGAYTFSEKAVFRMFQGYIINAGSYSSGASILHNAGGAGYGATYNQAGSIISKGGPASYGFTAKAGPIILNAGSAYAASTLNLGGDVTIATGGASGAGAQAGSMVLNLGSGTTNGVMLIGNMGTTTAISGVVYAESLTGIMHRRP